MTQLTRADIEEMLNEVGLEPHVRDLATTALGLMDERDGIPRRDIWAALDVAEVRLHHVGETRQTCPLDSRVPLLMPCLRAV